MSDFSTYEYQPAKNGSGPQKPVDQQRVKPKTTLVWACSQFPAAECRVLQKDRGVRNGCLSLTFSAPEGSAPATCIQVPVWK
jgi:hypothetical protein